jgi:hypothetical protein
VKSAYLLLLLSWMPLAAPNAAEQPFTITITAPTPMVKAGSDVWVVVKITNHSLERLDESGSISGMTSLDPYLGFDVRDTRGNLIAKRVYEHPELATGHPVNRCIEPGETLTEEQNVSRLYDMTQPGSYIVQVSRPRSGMFTRRVVKSNKLTIVVTLGRP